MDWQLNQARDELNRAKQQITELESDKAKLNDALQKVERSQSEAQSQLKAALEAELDKRWAQAQEEHLQLSQKANERALKSQAECEDAHKQLNTALAENEQLTDKVAALQEQLTYHSAVAADAAAAAAAELEVAGRTIEQLRATVLSKNEKLQHSEGALTEALERAKSAEG